MIYIYPTDTAYALGCDSRDEGAVKKIFEIKGRNKSKTLPLIASGIDMVREWCELSGKAEELAEKYWPGPLTLVLPVKKRRDSIAEYRSRMTDKSGSAQSLPRVFRGDDGLTSSVINEESVAIRVPDSEEARNLSKYIGAPICSTSANKSGNENCYSIDEVRASLGDGINLVDEIIDKGALEKKEASTIVKIEGGKINILREGVIVL